MLKDMGSMQYKKCTLYIFFREFVNLFLNLLYSKLDIFILFRVNFETFEICVQTFNIKLLLVD